MAAFHDKKNCFNSLNCVTQTFRYLRNEISRHMSKSAAAVPSVFSVYNMIIKFPNILNTIISNTPLMSKYFYGPTNSFLLFWIKVRIFRSDFNFLVFTFMYFHASTWKKKRLLVFTFYRLFQQSDTIWLKSNPRPPLFLSSLHEV